MRLSILSFLLLALVSCGTSKSSQKESMWANIADPAPSKTPTVVASYFTLNTGLFVDSLFRNYEKVVLPLPHPDKSINEYEFKEIYDVDNKRKEDIRGFIGRNIKSPELLVTLYVQNGNRLSARWSSSSIEWVLDQMKSDTFIYYRQIDVKKNKPYEYQYEYETY